MLKHFIYSSFSKLTTSPLCSLYYRYSSKVSSFFCILSFLVIAISIDQTFYSATHYLAAVWLDSRHDFNIKSVEANDDRKLYQHQMLLSEGRFELQSIKADQEDDQKVDQDLTQNLTQIRNMNRTLTKIRSKKWFLFRIKL